MSRLSVYFHSQDFPWRSVSCALVFVGEDHLGVRDEGWTVVGDGKGNAELPQQKLGRSSQRSLPRQTWDSWLRQETHFRGS